MFQMHRTALGHKYKVPLQIERKRFLINEK